MNWGGNLDVVIDIMLAELIGGRGTTYTPESLGFFPLPWRLERLERLESPRIALLLGITEIVRSMVASSH